ncbi:integrase core domain-containing protein [Roseibium polysiphoniae]|uniref:integrase core domain-containing protein n=1 Tax=Roseibium polysiphoniae TaxID=2571221 RepID=UPI003B8A6DDB
MSTCSRPCGLAKDRQRDDECLNEHLFRSCRDVRDIIENGKIDYNLNRPHPSLDGLTPHEFETQSNKDHTLNRTNL